MKEIAREALADNLTGESAKAAYYIFLSLFPLILVIFALTGYFGGDQAFQWIMDQIRSQTPPTTAAFLDDVVRQITSNPEAGALGIGLVLTFWSASGSVAALADGLNTVYDVEERRGWLKKRGMALLLLLAVVVLLVGGAVVIVAGPPIIEALGLGVLADILRWPVAAIMIVSLFWILYYFLPNRDQSQAKGKVLIGAVVGALVWLAVTAAFRFYVSNFGNYNKAYGSVGVIIVLMLWLYLTALSILFGGEVAAVLEARGRGERGAGEPGEERGEGEDEKKPGRAA